MGMGHKFAGFALKKEKHIVADVMGSEDQVTRNWGWLIWVEKAA